MSPGEGDVTWVLVRKILKNKLYATLYAYWVVQAASSTKAACEFFLGFGRGHHQ